MNWEIFRYSFCRHCLRRSIHTVYTSRSNDAQVPLSLVTHKKHLTALLMKQNCLQIKKHGIWMFWGSITKLV